MYVSQPEVKPGCVLRRANFNVLERRGLVDSQQVGLPGQGRHCFGAQGCSVHGGLWPLCPPAAPRAIQLPCRAWSAQTLETRQAAGGK